VLQDVTRLKELGEVKRDFLSMITHDLRSPLATIKGLITELVPSLDGDSELHSDIEAIDEEIDQTIELVSNLLDMSRIEAGAYPLDMEIAHMIDMSEDAIARARRSRVGTDREVEADVPADLPPLFADPSQLGRVLNNLLSNALKYSSGKVEMTSRLSESGEEVRTVVIDSGIGIPIEESDLVFDKFLELQVAPAPDVVQGLDWPSAKRLLTRMEERLGLAPPLVRDQNSGSPCPYTKRL
jgi:two-component system phosphate regulon sensor histidine kinase PhoR